MKVIYKGKLVDIDGDTIDGKTVITSDNLDEFHERKTMKQWNDLEMQQKSEFKIGNSRVLSDSDSLLWEDNHIISNPV